MTADLKGYLREKAKDTLKSNVVSLKVILEKAEVFFNQRTQNTISQDSILFENRVC